MLVTDAKGLDSLALGDKVGLVGCSGEEGCTPQVCFQSGMGMW